MAQNIYWLNASTFRFIQIWWFSSASQNLNFYMYHIFFYCYKKNCDTIEWGQDIKKLPFFFKHEYTETKCRSGPLEVTLHDLSEADSGVTGRVQVEV